MANVVQLKHLEHIEDEMFNWGSEGCHASVRFMKELIKMLGKKESSAFMQTKWDGAPSVVCGIDPASGLFFVGNKSVFNKSGPKIAFSERDVDVLYPDQPGLAIKLKMAYRYFSKLGIRGVIQGDLMFTKEDKKYERVDGEDLITFRPNTITYGIPKNHPIGKEVDLAEIGVVFHTHYTGSDLSTMSAGPGANVRTFSKIPQCVVIENDTPMHDINVSQTILNQFSNSTSKIERMCQICGTFLNHLVENMGTTGDKKYHVASYIKQFFNSEIREGRAVQNIQSVMKSFGEFYHSKMLKEIEKVKSDKGKTQKRELLYTGLKYIEEHEREFSAMFALYKEMQIAKKLVIDQLDHLETFRTFVQTDNGYKVTTPEGYVLHHEGDMIKLVNRLEFAFNNFNLQKQWK